MVMINQNSVFLDVSVLCLLAALSFITSVRPRAILDFVREAGTRFLGQASCAIHGSEPSNA